MIRQQTYSRSLSDLIPQIVNKPGAGTEIAEIRVTGLSLDSRTVRGGDLFFSLGSQARILDYARAAEAVGVAAIAANDPKIEEAEFSVPVYVDPRLQQRVSAIADIYFGCPSSAVEVIGITGTNGKTSCCYWLSWLFNQLGRKTGQIGTLGAGMSTGMGGGDTIDAGVEGNSLLQTGMTTPDAIQFQHILSDCRNQSAATVVAEVSSHGLDQGRVSGVRFNTALFTNLSQDHLDYHPDMEAYLQAKLRLFSSPGLKTAIVNLDDGCFARVKAALGDNVQLHTYSLEDSSADIYLSEIQFNSRGCRVRVESRWGGDILEVPIFGRYNLSNLLAVLVAALDAGFSLVQLKPWIGQLPVVPGRMQVVSAGHGPSAVVDYAHTPDAVKSVLSALMPHVAGRMIVVMGCGGDRDRSKRPLMTAAGSAIADRLILTSDNPRTEAPARIIEDMVVGLAAAASQKLSVELDRAKAISKAFSEAGESDWVVVLGKGHETYQEINGVRRPFSDVEHCRALLGLKNDIGVGERL